MTDRTDKGRNLEDSLHQLYQNWDEKVSAPPFTFMNVREQLGEQERPSPLSLASVQVGRLAAKWRFPVTKSQIGSISAIGAIVIVVALYIMLSGPGANDADEIVPLAEATAVPSATPMPESTPAPTATPAPTSTPVPPTPTPEPEVNYEALNDVGAKRAFPDGLLAAAEDRSRENAAILWDEYLIDSRVIGGLEDKDVMDLCSDHTGQIVNGSGIELKALTGDTFTWELESSPAGRWNEFKLLMTSDDFLESGYASHVVHRVDADTLYVLVLPIGGLTGGKSQPGYEHPIIHTYTANDISYEFSDTTETICR